jgi:predicted patatin/cPLA2 family phospholipase
MEHLQKLRKIDIRKYQMLDTSLMASEIVIFFSSNTELIIKFITKYNANEKFNSPERYLKTFKFMHLIK